MNFVFLDSWLRDRAAGSGSAVAIAGLARGLEALGHDVAVLRPRLDAGTLDLTRLLYNLTLAPRLSRAAERCGVAVGFDIDGFALPRRLTRADEFRYVVALKGVAAEERKFETGLQGLRFAAIERLEKRNARAAQRVFVTSDYARRAAVAAYGLDASRVRIAPEALDEGVRERAARARASAPLPADRAPVILSVARQYRRKDSPVLLQAFRRVLARIPEARLRVVGDGPELADTRRLAGRLGLGERVTFTGALSSTDALDAEYRAARVFSLPSRQEGFGIVFLEAMAYGLPIAAVRAAAVPEVAPHDETSLLVAPGDAEALADALERLLTDRALAGRLGEAGVARAARFAWTATARSFLAGLED